MTDNAGYRPTDDSALRWEDCHCTKCGQPDKKCECVALTPGTKVIPTSNSKVYEDGELWSFIRRCMAQGKDIHLDHAERTYEEYSARLDVAALERLPELQAYIVRAVVAARGSNETSEPRRRERIAAQIAHGMLHILDDSEENAQTGVVSLEISGEDWQELNRVIELLGDDPHEALHDMIGVNS